MGKNPNTLQNIWTEIFIGDRSTIYNSEYAIMFLYNSIAHQENFNIPYLTAANDKITVLGYSQSVTEQ